MSKHAPCHDSPATPPRRPLAWVLAAAIALTVLVGLHLAAQEQPAGTQTTTAQQAPAATEQPPASAGPAPAATGAAPAVTEQPPAVTGQPPASTEQAPAATGQTPPTTEQPPATTGPAPVPAIPAITPAMMAQGTVLMNFNDAPLESVLSYLSEAAALEVVHDVSVDGRVNILSRQPVSVDEAITLLNSALKDKGYAALRMGRILKIVTLDEAKKSNIPVRSGGVPELIVPSDEVITQIIPIRYLDAVRLRDDLAPLIPTYAQLTANASSNSLILTDTSANVRRIVEIIQALDSHMSTVAEMKIFRLEYALASDLASMINTQFAQQQTTGNQRAGLNAIATIFAGGRGGGGRGGAATQDQGAQAPRVLATADARTNTLVVTGPGDTLKTVEELVKNLDSNPAEEEDVLVYPLKNATAANLTTVLNALFQTSTSTTGGRATTTGARGTTTGARGTTTTAAGRTGASNQALAGLSGQVYVVSDADTNSLLIRTPPKNFELVRTIIASLDRPVPQVLIKVLIAEVTHEDTVDMGVEFSVLNLLTGSDDYDLSTDFGVAAQSQGLIYKVIHGDTTAILRLLETVGKIEVLSRPYILASDNQEATITVGDTVPFVQNTRTTDTGNVINTVSYQDIGIIMTVTAHINPDGLVIMDIAPEISSISTSTVPISENFNAAVFTKRSASTRVDIRDGQTIVIGGLIQDSKNAIITKVPILGDIPLLGLLFRRTIDGKKKTELLIFLTPLVAQLPDTLPAMSAGELSRTRIIRGAVRPGAFQEQLDGMKGGMAPPEEPEESPGTATLPPVIPPVMADP